MAAERSAASSRARRAAEDARRVVRHHLEAPCDGPLTRAARDAMECHHLAQQAVHRAEVAAEVGVKLDQRGRHPNCALCKMLIAAAAVGLTPTVTLLLDCLSGTAATAQRRTAPACLLLSLPMES